MYASICFHLLFLTIHLNRNLQALVSHWIQCSEVLSNKGRGIKFVFTTCHHNILGSKVKTGAEGSNRLVFSDTNGFVLSQRLIQVIGVLRKEKLL